MIAIIDMELCKSPLSAAFMTQLFGQFLAMHKLINFIFRVWKEVQIGLKYIKVHWNDYKHVVLVLYIVGLNYLLQHYIKRFDKYMII